MELSLRFLGAAGTVTGSKTLVEYNGKRVLVDCGLFQGLKVLRTKNWTEFPIEPKTIDAIVLTHAHLDHCGYIPVLVKNGFQGEIHCTEPTRALTEIILNDSAKIQEEETERANRHGYTKHKPAEPLYNRKDVMKSLSLFITHKYHEWVILNNHFKFRLHNAGHILGSAILELRVEEKNLVFTGDLGRSKPLILSPPSHVEHADLLVMESTYGDRLHPDENTKEELRKIVWDTYRKNGQLFVPTFAVERAQELLFLLSQLKIENKLPDISIYLDSPMGVSATEVMMGFTDWHKLTREEIRAIDSETNLIVDSKISRTTVADAQPKIVLAGSGMVTGGRILHYLNRYIGDPRTTVLLVGFQAAGTRGRALEEGATEVKFFGRYHPIKAEIKKIYSLSSHADQGEIIKWMKHIKKAPKQVYLNHGEPHASDALRVKIESELGWDCQVADPEQVYRF